MNKLRLVLIFLLLFLFSLFFVFTVTANGKTFVKTWQGATGYVTDIVVTNVDTQTVLYSGDLAGFPAKFEYLYHNQNLTIAWTDWRGTHLEEVCVECGLDHTERLVNCIPYPKFAVTRSD